MNQVFGLPSHPLLVHIPIVLIPLLALAAAAFVFRPAWRPGLSMPLAALALLTTLGTFFAANTGESLQGDVKRTALVRAHADMGGQLKVVGVLFGLAVLGMALLDQSERRGRRRIRFPAQRQLFMFACAASIVMAGLATVWDVRTGHSGAKAVWTETGRSNVASGELGSTQSSPVPNAQPISAAPSR